MVAFHTLHAGCEYRPHVLCVNSPGAFKFVTSVNLLVCKIFCLALWPNHEMLGCTVTFVFTYFSD